MLCGMETKDANGFISKICHSIYFDRSAILIQTKFLVICTEHVFADIRFVPLAVPPAIVSAAFCGIPQYF
jgi:hypothetical protein